MENVTPVKVKPLYRGLTAERLQEIIELSFESWGEIDKEQVKIYKLLTTGDNRPKLKIEVFFKGQTVGTLPLSFFLTINAEGFIAIENWGSVKFAIDNPIKVYKLLTEVFILSRVPKIAK